MKPCKHPLTETADGCPFCSLFNENAAVRERWTKPKPPAPLPKRAEPPPNRVHLCIHYIDGKPLQKPDNRVWRRCEPTGKEVCVCVDCTLNCPHFATETA